MDLQYEDNRIFMENEDGKVVAEITFPEVNENLVDITHTRVDESLQGQGVASKLVTAVAEKLIKDNKKAIPSCPYAKVWFERHEEYKDVVHEEIR